MSDYSHMITQHNVTVTESCKVADSDAALTSVPLSRHRTKTTFHIIFKLVN